MTIRTKAQELVAKVMPVLVLTICCLTSLLIATNVRCHGSLALYLYDDLTVYNERHEVHWLGATHGMFVFMFVPLFTGLIDHFKFSYRICMAVSGLSGLLSCFLSTGFTDPGYMIFTDTVVAGGAASAMLSTVILVADDHFPRESSLRIFATTMVQGVAFATFFLIDGYAIALKLAGWRTVFYAYGSSVGVLGLLGAALFSRPALPLHHYDMLPSGDNSDVEDDGDDDRGAAEAKRAAAARSETSQPVDGDAKVDINDADAAAVAAPDDDFRGADGVDKADGPDGFVGGGTSLLAAGRRQRSASVIDQIFEKKDWKKRLISLSQNEMDSSRTSLLWLLERLLAAVVSDGIFLFLLLHSRITSHPYIIGAAKSTPTMPGITTAFLFTVGSTSSYLGGGILGCLIRGRLLVVYMTGALVNLCSLIGWVAVLDTFYHGELVFAWFCGLGIGAINTFSFAASEEATGIAARSIFPFTKLANGLSIVVIEVTHSALTANAKSQMEILLIVLLMLSLAQFAVLVLIRQINQRLDASSNRFKSPSQLGSSRTSS